MCRYPVSGGFSRYHNRGTNDSTNGENAFTDHVNSRACQLRTETTWKKMSFAGGAIYLSVLAGTELA